MILKSRLNPRNQRIKEPNKQQNQIGEGFWTTQQSFGMLNITKQNTILDHSTEFRQSKEPDHLTKASRIQGM